jgi:uncharacterized protein
MRAAAVAETPTGLVGSTATFTITAATNGSGHVFLDTFPLTEIDMQGSARLAARVAAQISGKSLSQHDFFFVVRSGSQQIGGPSAGGALAVGATAALNGWNVRPDVLMTGTINPDGSIGPVGGIPEKASAAASIGMSTFLFPAGQEIIPLGDGSALNLTAYCETELRITCLPIADAREAVSLMTDYVIVRPPVTGEVTGEAFLQKVAPLSAELVAGAEARVAEARQAIALVDVASGQGTLAQELAVAEAKLASARNAVANGTHYTAASLSFQTSVAAHSLRETARYLAGGDANASLDEARGAIALAKRDVDGAPARDTSRFESAGAAQDRLLQAEAQLAAAEQSAALATPSSVMEAISAATFATARDTITASEELIAYVEAVFFARDVGGPLVVARDRLAAAERAQERGYHPGAMLMALEAEVRASALLELAGFGGDVPDSKFEAARTEAARAIQGARGRGVEPLLAQSVYEFSFAQADDIERLSYLGMARVTANLAGLPGVFTDPAPPETRFQGIPDVLGVAPAWVGAAFAVGLAMGAGIGLAALMPREKPRAPRRPDARGTDAAPLTGQGSAWWDESR